MVVGEAGSGKTTYLKMVSKYLTTTCQMIVFFVSFMNIEESSKKITLFEFLCNHAWPNHESLDKNQKRNLEKIFHQHQNKIAIVLDGYDQLSFNLAEKSTVHISEKTTPSKWLSQLLSRFTLKKSLLIISSRPASVLYFDGPKRAGFIYRLKGFKIHGIKNLLSIYNESQSCRIFDNIISKSNKLLEFANNPFFLCLIALAFEQQPDYLTQDTTLTELYNFIFAKYYRSVHAVAEANQSCCSKLLKMLFDLISKGVYVIKRNDLTKYKITLADLDQWTMIDGGTKEKSHRLLPEDKMFRTSHQSVMVSL